MHKLIDYICDELEELERKADKEGKLSMAEIQYGDMLAHFKKNLMKAEEMSEGESYSMGYGHSYNTGYYDMPYGGRSYADRRGTHRDSRGRYSRDSEMISELRDLMQDAPNEHVRKEFERFIGKIESM
jgi:hypothetical protein